MPHSESHLHKKKKQGLKFEEQVKQYPAEFG